MPDHPTKNVTIGLRIPKDFFVTKGIGESNITIHAGSYHLALLDAGIERFNIMAYSSVLPKIAREIEKPNNIDDLEPLTHGAVMEVINAVANAEKGERATAAIVWGWLYDKQTNEKFGGFVCEYNGHLEEKDAIESLKSSINELYTNGGYDKKYDLRDIKSVSSSIVPKKNYGTAICALCFVNHEIPIIN